MDRPAPKDLPPDRPADSSDERIDLLADPAPQPREVPVRPRELDLIRPDAPDARDVPEARDAPNVPEAPAQPQRPSGPAIVRPTQPAPTPPPLPASGDVREEVAEGPVLCHRCKYDLRGRPGGARCPECGEIIRPPKRIRIELPEGERKSARDALFDAWHLIAGSSLASVALVSPLVFALPIGVAIASCIGFAAAFRLSAMRNFSHLPKPLHEPIDRTARWWRRNEHIQAAIAIAVTAGGLLSTVGVVGPRAIPLYYLALVAWWMFCANAIVTQLRLGDRLSQILVDPEVLPLEAAQRAIRWMRLNAVVGAAGGLLAVYCTVSWGAGSRLPFASAAGQLATIVLLGATAFQCVIAIHARAHAILVANCVFESEYFRADPNRRSRRVEADANDDSPDAVPPAKRFSFTPKGDDAPIELPAESPKD